MSILSDKRPPWDALILTSFDRGDCTDFSSIGATATVGSGVSYNTRVIDLDGNATNATVSYPENTLYREPPLTVMAWIKIDTYSSYRLIVGKINQTGVTATGWHLYHGNGISRGLAFGHSTNNANFRQAWTATSELTTGTWYHVAATLSAKNATALLYINGVAKSTTTGTGGTVTTMNTADPLRIGGKADYAATVSHDGMIDDVRVFSSVLTANEIAAIYNETSGATRP